MLWAIRGQWQRLGLQAKPLNRAAAESACRVAYTQAEFAHPPAILWMSSPLAAAFASHLLLTLRHPPGSVGAGEVPRKLFTDLHAPHAQAVLQAIWNQFVVQWSHLSDREWQWLRKPIYAVLLRRVNRKAEAEVGIDAPWMLGHELFDCVGIPMEGEFDWWHSGQVLNAQLTGDAGKAARSLDANGLFHYESLGLRRLAVFETLQWAGLRLSMLDGLIGLRTHTAGWWLFRGVALLCRPPMRITFDPERRLHASDGMAVEYADGWGVYAWHGVNVPRQVICAPDSLTPEQILSERNVEVRRIMIERFGVDRLLSRARAKCLDMDQDGRRSLFLLPMHDDEPLVAVRVHCPSTGQVYFLRVPPEVRTCRAAVAWTFGFEQVEEYRPIVET